jgi:hypothetical protein
VKGAKEMTYIKIGGNRYPATINGRMRDTEWDNRESKAITLEMDYATAAALFVDGAAWSIIDEEQIPDSTELQEVEYDNSEYGLAGDITDHRDGTVTCKMGKLTELEEAYEMMLGGM